MSYAQYLASTPLFWIALCGLFVGTCASRVARIFGRRVEATDTGRSSGRRRQRNNDDLARSLGSVLFLLGLTIACLLALAAVFIPGPEQFVDPRVPWTFGASTILFFFMFRFKLSFGIPVLVLLCAAGVLFALSLSPWTITAPHSEILRLRVLSVGQQTSIEIVRPAGLPRARSLRQFSVPAIEPVAQVLVFDPEYFFLGGTLAYRDVEPNGNPPAPVSPPPGKGLSGFIARFFAANAHFLPGVRLVDSHASPFRPFPLKTYSIAVGADGELSVSTVGP